jgi:glycosyltransferase involved in cell wall biosynthesis
MNYRLAWLVPSAAYGAYWPPVLSALKKLVPQTIFYTGCLWPKYDPHAPGTEVIQVIGDTKFVPVENIETGYSRGYIIASPIVVWPLLKFKPDVVFASGFSIWTVLAVLFKPIGGWKLVLVYESSSPNVDFRDSKFRSTVRRWITKFVDTFISNSQRGKNYLIEGLGVAPDNVQAQPYMVPDTTALLHRLDGITENTLDFQRPIFLCVGQIVSRKGIKHLLDACAVLKTQGYVNYTVIMVGDGPQRPELETMAQELGLTEQIKWTGWVEYGRLGAFFKEADVFLFPTLEDTWGMVLLEAMAFGKPVLCSQWAGAAEMVVPGENGHIFDPYNATETAQVMQYFIDNPDAIKLMGQKSQALISGHTPEAAAQFISDVASRVTQKKN